MENPILKAKKELIHWVNNLDDLDVLSELLELKEKEKSIPLVSDTQAEYVVKDDFDERFAKGLTLEESKKRTFDFIESLAWNK